MHTVADRHHRAVLGKCAATRDLDKCDLRPEGTSVLVSSRIATPAFVSVIAALWNASTIGMNRQNLKSTELPQCVIFSQTARDTRGCAYAIYMVDTQDNVFVARQHRGMRSRAAGRCTAALINAAVRTWRGMACNGHSLACFE
jgi:hypothetical protein